MMNAEDLFPGFESRDIETAPDVHIRVRIGGRGDPLLLLHGHPQTSAIWHKVAPALAERFTEADPAAYMRDVMGRRSAGLAPFDPRALSEYQRTLALPGSAHGLCEDYRASAGIDLDHDRGDRERGVRLTVPLLVLWGRDGVVDRCFKPLDEWRRVADDVRGEPLPCGHYIAEEAPSALLAEAMPFLAAA